MDKPVGPLVGTIIIILVLVLGALYVFMKKTTDTTIETNNDVQTIETEAQTIDQELSAQEAELNALEAELEASQI